MNPLEGVWGCSSAPCQRHAPHSINNRALRKVLPLRQITPVDIQLTPDGIRITWDDGHQGYHEHRALRYQCGCANCVNEMTGKRMISLADVRRDVEALDWLEVGRYALQFLWSDRHTTGIYPYTVLRAICQCDVCKEAVSETSEGPGR